MANTLGQISLQLSVFVLHSKQKIKQILKITFKKTITDGDAYLYTH